MADQDSILTSVKKVLGLDENYTAFDIDIIMHINSTFAGLHQMGVGPEDGFIIEDKEPKWADFIGETKNISSVKSYMAAKVKLLFDPPATSFAIAATEKVIAEYEWRLTAAVEKPYVPPPADVYDEFGVVI